MLTHWRLDPWEQTYVTFISMCDLIFQTNVLSIHCPQDRHLLETSLCQCCVRFLVRSKTITPLAQGSILPGRDISYKESCSFSIKVKRYMHQPAVVHVNSTSVRHQRVNDTKPSGGSSQFGSRLRAPNYDDLPNCLAPTTVWSSTYVSKIMSSGTT